MAHARLRTLALRAAPPLAAALFLAGIEWLHAGGAGVPDAPLWREATFEVVAPAPEPPRAVTLPHDWRATHPRAERARYRLRVDLPPSRAGSDLYLPSTDPGTRVRVNGALVEEGDPFLALASRLWRVPLYVPVPGALWRDGANEVELDVRPVKAGDGYLAPLYAGTREALRPAYEARRFLQVTGIQVLVVASVAFALFMGLLWLLRRKEEAALWFAASLLVVAFGFWNLVALQVWVPKPSWNWVGVALPAWLLATLTLFTHRLLGVRRPRLELALGAAALAGTLFFAAAEGTAPYHAVRPVWGALVLAGGLYPGFLVLRHAVRTASLEATLLLTAALALFVAAAHDLGVANGALPFDHDLAIAWAVVVGISLTAWIFLRRFIAALDTSEALSAELEQRVAEKGAELARNYERLRHLERAQAVARERERMMADLHDGLGGQLVSTLAMLGSGDAKPSQLESALQAALDDMRLLIHSIEADETELVDALATLRARLAPRLRQAGIEVDWAVADVPTPPGFGPEKALQVMRIVQEAVANVLKHAGARTLRLRSGVADGSRAGEAFGSHGAPPSDLAAAPREVFVAIEDDGRGFAPAAGTGRGLANMRRRAEALGGRLELHSDASGTRVRLSLALGDPASAHGWAARNGR